MLAHQRARQFSTITISSEAYESNEWYHFFLTHFYAIKKYYNKALKHLEKTLMINPHNFRALATRAIYYERGHDSFPSHPERASAYYRQAQKNGRKKTKKDFQRLLKKHPTNPEVIYHYALSRRNAKAEQLLTHRSSLPSR